MGYFIEAVLIPMCFVLAFFIPSLIGYIKYKKDNRNNCESKINETMAKIGFPIAFIFSFIVTILIFYFAYF